jgi:hypothetical protein
MTLGRDLSYAALAGLIHGGLTVYPAQWAGLRDAAPLALGYGLKPHPWTELKNACRWRLCASSPFRCLRWIG